MTIHYYLSAITSINLFVWHIVCFFATYLHEVYPIPFLKNNGIISYSYERQLGNVIQLPKTFKMKKLFAIALLAGVATLGATAAEARQGCGPGGHRGYYGHCRPNRGGAVVVTPGGALIVGNYYRGRGYWDGHRYWHNRYRYHGGWRYR